MTDLHLWKIAFDSRRLMALAREQRLLHPKRETDLGYVLHAGLHAVFGDAAPTPFVAESMLSPTRHAEPEQGPTESVLAYAAESLEPHMARLVNSANLVHLGGCASKPVPAVAQGARLAFSTRVMPIVRSRAAMEGRPEGGREASREVDAWLAECHRVGKEVRVDRGAIYRDWLSRQLEGEGLSHGGAELEDFSLQSFRRARVLRKEARGAEGRRSHRLERPDALVSGTLVVRDAEAFRALLARGIGRHRGFGFGMLLIRRAS